MAEENYNWEEIERRQKEEIWKSYLERTGRHPPRVKPIELGIDPYQISRETRRR